MLNNKLGNNDSPAGISPTSALHENWIVNRGWLLLKDTGLSTRSFDHRPLLSVRLYMDDKAKWKGVDLINLNSQPQHV